MAKKKKGKFSLPSLFDGLREETIQGIWAIVFFVIALFLMLAALDLAGIVGDMVYKSLSRLLGVGYYLLPLLTLLLTASFIGTLKQDVGKARIAGSILFFISGLGLIDLLFKSGGGLIGSYISAPLLSLFDFWATVLLLLALVIISLVIILDIRLSLPSLSLLRIRLPFTRKELDEGDEGTADESWEEEEYDMEEDTGEYGESVEEDEEDEGGTIPYTDSREDKKGGDENEFIISASYETYTPPPISLLEKDRGKPGHGDVKANANVIKRTLQNFGIQVEMDEVSIGPSVTRYSLKPAEGVRLSKIVGLQNNLELALASHPVRIEAPIPGKALVGIEVPNSSKATLGLASMLSTQDYQDSPHPLFIALGKDITGRANFANLAKMPHILIAGATGSGKSVTIHGIISSLLYRNAPGQLRFLMIDPKRVELTLYNNIPHLLTPVVTDAKKAILALKWAAKEMERRYNVLETEKVRDVQSYHKNILAPALARIQKHGKETPDARSIPEPMPYVVIVIDELADIMQTYPRELEGAIVRLAQMSRAVGIHLILSTQRPSVNIITGLIKANIPARIALQVTSQIDSRTILDIGGAEKLLGAGDMLYLSGEMSKPLRIQASFISEKEVKDVVNFLKKQYEDTVPESIELTNEQTNDTIFDSSSLEESDEDDPLYDEAYEIITRAGKASTSYLQRKLGIGYSRAARLIDILEERGVVGPRVGSKPREVLDRITNTDAPENFDDSEKEGEEHDGV